ncbi:SDR family NAD(P)-dependent oxidoreductase [Alloalcanivorax sp. C16-1]|uniref:SDR family NAD(P)-dependent oxidoreductase n=1 Tax=Alloalcanivorax sp. C16-1 TaxID=3390051 RepID=UPI003971146E
MSRFSGKVIAITGAASGIGRATAVKLAGHQVALSLCDVSDEGLRETERLCRAAGASVRSARLDVSDHAAVNAWAEDTHDAFGGVNAIINNAGVSLSGAVGDLTLDDFEWIMGINFWGVVHGTRAFLPYLRASGDGHIVNISSLFGIIAMPGASAYNASKFAVRGFTESLSEELRLERAPVRVTCVHPGGIDTNIVAGGRVTPSESLGFETVDQAARDFKRLARTSPEAAAARIVRAMTRGRRRQLIGTDAWLLEKMQRLAPVAYQNLMVSFARRSARR